MTLTQSQVETEGWRGEGKGREGREREREGGRRGRRGEGGSFECVYFVERIAVAVVVGHLSPLSVDALLLLPPPPPPPPPPVVLLPLGLAPPLGRLKGLEPPLTT